MLRARDYCDRKHHRVKNNLYNLVYVWCYF